MSGGIYTVLRSDRPPSWKRRRTGELDSKGSSRRSSCLWEGCRRPGRLENESGFFYPYCSPAHQNFHYAHLFDMFKHGGTHVVKQSSGICNLSGCGRPVWVIDSSTGEAYDFCRRGHSVIYKESMAETWHLEDRLCKLNGCDNHVAVEKTSKKIHEYCCSTHLYSAAGARGRQAAERRLLAAGNAGKEFCSLSQDPTNVEPAKTDSGAGPSRRDEILQRSICQESPQQAKIDKERGYHEILSMDAIESCLRHLLNNPEDFENADPDRLFCVVPNVTDFHPFDEVTEFGGFRPRYYVYYVDSAGGKQRGTPEGFQWRRTSRKHRNKNVMTAYYRYVLADEDYDGHSDGFLEYLQFQEEKRKKELKGKRTRWKLHEFSLSGNVIGGKPPMKIPVISKIFQDEKGLPVWPRLPHKMESRVKEVAASKDCEPVLVGSSSQATFGTERGMTSSNSSNASPPGEGLPPGGETSQGANSKKFEGSGNCSFPQNTAIETSQGAIANTSNASVPVEALEEEIFHFGESNISSNASLGSGSPPGGESLQGASANDAEEFDVFAIWQDTLMRSRCIEATANVSNEQIPIGTFPELGLQSEVRELTSSSSSNASLGEGLPQMNSGCSFSDGFFDQSKFGVDNMRNWFMDGSFAHEGQEATWCSTPIDELTKF